LDFGRFREDLVLDLVFIDPDGEEDVRQGLAYFLKKAIQEPLFTPQHAMMRDVARGRTNDLGYPIYTSFLGY
jgi:hypothetical protein